MITPIEKQNVIIQPVDNFDRNGENVLIHQFDNTKFLWHYYHPAQ
jgi:hypothetical protein